MQQKSEGELAAGDFCIGRSLRNPAEVNRSSNCERKSLGPEAGTM
jgi:hypothetical protein